MLLVIMHAVHGMMCFLFAEKWQQVFSECDVGYVPGYFSRDVTCAGRAGLANRQDALTSSTLSARPQLLIISRSKSYDSHGIL